MAAAPSAREKEVVEEEEAEEEESPSKVTKASGRGRPRGRGWPAADAAEPAPAELLAQLPAPSKARFTGPSREEEELLWQQGYSCVGGVDEAGRGPLAGEP